MNFEDIKDQVLERLREIWSKIQESDTYILLRDRFENLPPRYQKTIIGFAIFLVAFVIYSIPASYMSAANELEESFQEKRDLTRDLIRASNVARSLDLPPMPPSGPALINQVSGVIKQQRVMDNQLKTVQAKENLVDKKLVPEKVQSEGVIAKLSQLNLRQVVHIGEDLENMQGVKLINMFVQADNTDPHYLNVDYEVAAFSVDVKTPDMLAPEEDDDKTDKKKKKKSKKAKRDQ